MRMKHWKISYAMISRSQTTSWIRIIIHYQRHNEISRKVVKYLVKVNNPTWEITN